MPHTQRGGQAAERESRGVTCTNHGETRGAIGAVHPVSCYIGGQEAVISAYATAADAQRIRKPWLAPSSVSTTSAWSSGST